MIILAPAFTANSGNKSIRSVTWMADGENATNHKQK
jgi:hypothetical protein